MFTDEDLVNTTQIDQLEYPTMPEISFNTSGIHKFLSPDPDSIPAIILKKCADEISPILQVIFTQSMNSGVLPSDWLSANITPIYKKNDRTNASNYRPIDISLTPICYKIMEHKIYVATTQLWNT